MLAGVNSTLFPAISGQSKKMTRNRPPTSRISVKVCITLYRM